MHPFITTSIPIKLEVGNYEDSICPIIMYTTAKNQAQVAHTGFVVLGPKQLDDLKGKDVRNNIRSKIIPLANTREKYFWVQKIITLLLVTLGILAWLI